MNTRDKLATALSLPGDYSPDADRLRQRADALLASDVLNQLRAEAWDEGMEWGRGNHLAPGNGPRGYAANPYRIERDGDTR